jgi:hypothetical protein
VRRRKRGISAIVLGAAALAFTAAPAAGYFERLVVSSRIHALGGAFVAVADDPSAVLINPAGLTQTLHASVLSTISHPYGLTDLDEYFFAAALPSKIGSFGISWHRLALDGVTSEDVFTLAYGRDLVRTSQDASLSVGAGIDIARVGYSGDDAYSENAWAGTLSVLLRPFPFIGAGYTVRNIGEPSLFESGAVHEGSGEIGTTLEATHAFGFAYHWNHVFSVLYERGRGQDGEWTDRVGVEVRAGDVLRLRSGLSGDELTGGVGVLYSNVTIDASVTSHDALGLSAVVSVGISLPGGDGKGEGGEW